jgi:hypothetical protein
MKALVTLLLTLTISCNSNSIKVGKCYRDNSLPIISRVTAVSDDFVVLTPVGMPEIMGGQIPIKLLANSLKLGQTHEVECNDKLNANTSLETFKSMPPKAETTSEVIEQSEAKLETRIVDKNTDYKDSVWETSCTKEALSKHFEIDVNSNSYLSEPCNKMSLFEDAPEGYNSIFSYHLLNKNFQSSNPNPFTFYTCINFFSRDYTNKTLSDERKFTCLSKADNSLELVSIEYKFSGDNEKLEVINNKFIKDYGMPVSNWEVPTKYQSEKKTISLLDDRSKTYVFRIRPYSQSTLTFILLKNSFAHDVFTKYPEKQNEFEQEQIRMKLEKETKEREKLDKTLNSIK